jgi:hypothetical protein
MSSRSPVSVSMSAGRGVASAMARSSAKASGLRKRAVGAGIASRLSLLLSLICEANI